MNEDERVGWWLIVLPALLTGSLYLIAAWRARRRLAKAQRAQRLRTPRFSVGADGRVEPRVDAASAIIYAPDDDTVVWQCQGDAVRPVASLTKLMTAVVVLAARPDLDRETTVEPGDLRSAHGSGLTSNARLSLRQLLHLMLIASDNGAARVLARAHAGSEQGFVDLMNDTASTMGLGHTHFVDASGLGKENVSSARDVARLVARAGSEPLVSEASLLLDFDCPVGSRRLVVRNTNPLVRTREAGLVAGKTGHTPEAGYCLATLFALPRRSPLALVVLGAPSAGARSWETRHLLAWATSATSHQAVERPLGA